MKSLGVALIVLGVSAGAAMAAESPFAGTWKLNVDKSTFTGGTVTYTKTATGYHYSNGATVAYNFAMDGKDYPVLADRTVSWTKNADGSWDTVFKAHGTDLAKNHRVLSNHGKTLTVSTTEFQADGTTVDETDVFERLSGGPGLAGKWRDAKAQGGAGLMTISTPSPGKFEIDDPADKETVAGSTDGAPTQVNSPHAPPGLMVSHKAVGPRTWRTSVTIKDKVYSRGDMVVSADGKTLTETSWIPGKETEKTVEIWEKQ